MHPALYNKYNLYLSLRYWNARISEAVVRSCSVKEVFLKILQNSQVFPLAQEFPVNFATFWRTPFFAEHLKWLLLAFAPIEIFYSHTVCNKSEAEVWIWLVSFSGGAKDFIFTCIFHVFLCIITYFIKIQMRHRIFSISFTGSKLNTWKMLNVLSEYSFNSIVH